MQLLVVSPCVCVRIHLCRTVKRQRMSFYITYKADILKMDSKGWRGGVTIFGQRYEQRRTPSTTKSGSAQCTLHTTKKIHTISPA